MATWQEFEGAAPELAARVRSLLQAHKHHTMATLRRDGSPRISGTEVDLAGGELAVGIMGGARRADDLRRDPRVAVHSHTEDPPDDDPSAWAGDAKVAGTAVEVGPERFVVDIREVVVTKVGIPADHLLIESWRPGEDVVRRERR